MKYKIALYLFWVFLIGFFLGCEEINEGCTHIEQFSDNWGTPLYGSQFPDYTMPYFNPNNSDEIIFSYREHPQSKRELVKYNLLTKERRTIYTGNFGFKPRWGKNDWILLHWYDGGNNIYKIKSSGEGLSPLTTNGNSFNPEWNINSDKIIYELGFTTPTKSLIVDIENNVLDTTLITIGICGSWQNKNFIAKGPLSGLNIGNVENNTTKTYDLEYNSKSLGGAEWLDDKRVIWCHTTGIYVTNIETEETELIKETCNSDTYQLPTYAPDIDKVIFQRTERVMDEDSIGWGISSLVMMNSDGTEQETIEIE